MYDVDPDTFEIMAVKVYASKFLSVWFRWADTDMEPANISDPNFQTTRK